MPVTMVTPSRLIPASSARIWADPMTRRVAALLAPPPGRQLALLAVATLLVLIAGVSAAEAARDLHALVEFAQSAR
jgi:hypothetical protein